MVPKFGVKVQEAETKYTHDHTSQNRQKACYYNYFILQMCSDRNDDGGGGMAGVHSSGKNLRRHHFHNKS